MALPDFVDLQDMLLRAKRDDQSWGDLFREIYLGHYVGERDQFSALQSGLSNSPLLQLLSTWDFYSSPYLDKAEAEFGVKSWQLTEYIESLREALSIGESDLIVYETRETSPSAASEKHTETSYYSTNSSQPRQVNPSSKVENPDYTESGSQSLANPSNQASGSREASKTVLGLICAVSALLAILVVLISTIASQKSGLPTSLETMLESREKPSSSSKSADSPINPPRDTTEQVYFTGIDLPITNKLCNRKGTFCIYGLATLVNEESGGASYQYSDVTNGQQVTINGKISVSNIERNGSNRSFTFAFRDDQSQTTPGYAAAGYFNLDQDSDPSKTGILTRFKTTESFGPKTPVGLENISYLFPR